MKCELFLDWYDRRKDIPTASTQEGLKFVCG